MSCSEMMRERIYCMYYYIRNSPIQKLERKGGLRYTIRRYVLKKTA